MQELDDMELIRRYAAEGSESAFAVLVQRHANMVYSVALRQVRNPSQAEEITQAVFIILARKAHSLRRGTVVPGWLHRTAWFAADNFRTAEMRRRSREQDAGMQSLSNETESDAWEQIAPLLDQALASLDDKDRNAIVLRFFNGRRFGEVAAALGTSEDAAKKRVNRAVERLRRFFTRQGVVLPAAVLTAAISTYSVQAAPAGLKIAASGAGASGSTLAVIKATLQTLLWSKLKSSIVVGTAAVLAAGITVATFNLVRSSRIKPAVQNNLAAAPDPAAPALILRPTGYPRPVDRTGTTPDYFVAQNMGLPRLLSFANEYPWWRRVGLPADAPTGHYDLLLPPGGNNLDRLRQEIRQQFDLVTRSERRMTDVLRLEKDPAGTGRLKTSDNARPSAAFSAEETAASRKLSLTRQPLSLMVRILERHLGVPVIDRTGLTGKYDVLLEWDKQASPDLEEEAVRRAITDQLGLRLAPARETVPVLVAEKAR